MGKKCEHKKIKLSVNNLAADQPNEVNKLLQGPLARFPSYEPINSLVILSFSGELYDCLCSIFFPAGTKVHKQSSNLLVNDNSLKECCA